MQDKTLDFVCTFLFLLPMCLICVEYMKVIRLAAFSFRQGEDPFAFFHAFNARYPDAIFDFSGLKTLPEGYIRPSYHTFIAGRVGSLGCIGGIIMVMGMMMMIMPHAVILNMLGLCLVVVLPTVLIVRPVRMMRLARALRDELNSTGMLQSATDSTTGANETANQTGNG